MAKKNQEDPFTVDPKGDLQSFIWIHTWFYKAYPSLTHLPTAPSLKEPLSGTKTNLFTYLPKVARLSPATLHFFVALKTDQQQLPSLSLSMCSISAQDRAGHSAGLTQPSDIPTVQEPDPFCTMKGWFYACQVMMLIPRHLPPTAIYFCKTKRSQPCLAIPWELALLVPQN